MTFEVGQLVTVSNPSTPYGYTYKGCRGAITEYEPVHAYPYGVTFANGVSLGFLEEELSVLEKETNDPVTSPAHYTWLPNGLEVIDVTQGLNFCLGNVVKYVLRAGRKTEDPMTDLRKAAWYIEREIARLESH
ncbi:DUF3310 domain-containing protein [Streptomyces sp. NPDC050095]|uniref:DUF3310 domain-containing protein n=1 Tax=unclassified Streptomyces TaxID=2593676 RepID=UPI003420353E